jgi:hypothetical protein
MRMGLGILVDGFSGDEGAGNLRRRASVNRKADGMEKGVGRCDSPGLSWELKG